MEIDLDPEDYTRSKILHEGKTRNVYEIDGVSHLLMIESKNKLPIGVSKCSQELEGIAKLSTYINATVYAYLKNAGVVVAYEKLFDETTTISRRCNMIPIEWQCRRLATKPYLERNPGIHEDFFFSPICIEAHCMMNSNIVRNLKESQLMCTPYEVFKNKPMSPSQYLEMKITSEVVFEIFERAWSTLDFVLADLKLQYGICVKTGEILLAGFIDYNSWNLSIHGLNPLKDTSENGSPLQESLTNVKLAIERTVENLELILSTDKESLISILMERPEDSEIGAEIATRCSAFGIRTERRVVSAYVSTEQTLRIIRDYNYLASPTLFITVSARTNFLGSLVAGHTCLPVINCPSDIRNSREDALSTAFPFGLSCSSVTCPEAAALHAASILSLNDHSIWAKLRTRQLLKILEFSDYDDNMNEKNVIERS